MQPLRVLRGGLLGDEAGWMLDGPVWVGLGGPAGIAAGGYFNFFNFFNFFNLFDPAVQPKTIEITVG